MKKVDPNRLLRLADWWDVVAQTETDSHPPWWRFCERAKATAHSSTLRVCAEYLRHEVREDQRKGKA